MVSIGGAKIETPLALGPMAGVTDAAFRTICREQGAGLTCTEMVSAKALCYQDKKSVPLLARGEGERPFAAQIFGSDPVCMQEGAAIAARISGADIIDINMGCPVPKVANSGDGSGLMRTPELAVKVLEAVIRGAGRPVTVKFRLGWDSGSINCVEFARAMEQAGAAAIAVHDALWEQGILTPRSTQREIALAYYQWIAAHCTYDDAADNTSVSHLPYSLFRNGKAVCDGYTGAYNLLLKLEGIDCYALPNDTHIWTVAVLDGETVHIDATWGDQGAAASGQYFAMTPRQSHTLHPWPQVSERPS